VHLSVFTNISTLKWSLILITLSPNALLKKYCSCQSSVTVVWVFSWFSDRAVTLPVCHVFVFSQVCCEHMAVMLFPCAM